MNAMNAINPFPHLVALFPSGCAWEVGNPVMLHIGDSTAVSCMTAIHGRLWCGLGCNAVVVNTTTLAVEVRIESFALSRDYFMRV